MVSAHICAVNVIADVVSPETNICYAALYVNKGSYIRNTHRFTHKYSNILYDLQEWDNTIQYNTKGCRYNPIRNYLRNNLRNHCNHCSSIIQLFYVVVITITVH